ncbi:MAG: hypothetical protein ABSE18_04495 [Minisyncoccia bacterium]|jgi:hypothetical protein
MNKYLKAIIQGLFILGIAAFAIWFLNLFIPKNQGADVANRVADQVKQIILKRPTCAGTSAEFEQLKEQGGYIPLLQSSTGMYGIAGGDFVNEKQVTVNRTGSGSEVACGYLYINAGVGKRALDNEDVYIVPGGFGGHLQSSAAIINQIVNSSTEMIFSLDNIQYRSNKNMYTANWAALLNVSNEINFEIALNTTDPRGFINEVGIAYKCWNPQTGDVTTDCRLSAQQ